MIIKNEYARNVAAFTTGSVNVKTDAYFSRSAQNRWAFVKAVIETRSAYREEHGDNMYKIVRSMDEKSLPYFCWNANHYWIANNTIKTLYSISNYNEELQTTTPRQERSECNDRQSCSNEQAQAAKSTALTAGRYRGGKGQTRLVDERGEPRFLSYSAGKAGAIRAKVCKEAAQDTQEEPLSYRGG